MYEANTISGGRAVAVAHADGAAGLSERYSARLNWLLRANALAAEHRRLFRSSREVEERMLMRHPLDAPNVYAVFGLLLGTFPAAAIFSRIFRYGLDSSSDSWLMFFLCLMVNLTCGAVGLLMGSTVGASLERVERASWNRMLLVSLWFGAVWGTAVGGVGGTFTGLGAISGVLHAVPTGMAAFLLFTPLHRLFARGGMMDARYFWPLACGITMTIAALALNL